MRNLQFPELPRQWSSHGYEIDELLGQGSYGAVYRMVRNKGTDQEEYWALKVIEKNLTKKRIRFQYRNDIAAARRDFGKEFNKLAREVNILESFMDEKHIVQIPKAVWRLKAVVWKKCRRKITGVPTYRWNILRS